MREHSTARLRKVFLENFTAIDLAEPLRSFDGSCDADAVRRFMGEQRFRVMGVRERGSVVGYVLKGDLREGPVSRNVRRFETGEVIPHFSGLPDVVSSLSDRDQVFVSLLGQVYGIVTRTDLLKPPMRMWLFGIITIIEINLTWTVESLYPGESWKALISPGRLAKGEDLRRERERREKSVRLLDCLQLSDKAEIVIGDRERCLILGFPSRRQARRQLKELGYVA